MIIDFFNKTVAVRQGDNLADLMKCVYKEIDVSEWGNYTILPYTTNNIHFVGEKPSLIKVESKQLCPNIECDAKEFVYKMT